MEARDAGDDIVASGCPACRKSRRSCGAQPGCPRPSSLRKVWSRTHATPACPAV